jgi:hypothetical protein
MFPKLLFAMLAAGAIACALLVNRQQRIDTAHEMSRVHEHLLLHQRTIWDLQSQIAQRCRPAEVRQAMQRLTVDWAPIPREPGRRRHDPRPMPAARAAAGTGSRLRLEG